MQSTNSTTGVRCESTKLLFISNPLSSQVPIREFVTVKMLAKEQKCFIQYSLDQPRPRRPRGDNPFFRYAPGGVAYYVYMEYNIQLKRQARVNLSK